MTVLLWFRTDLRLLDHQPLTRACQQGSPLIPLYCLDPRQFGETSLGLRPRTGPFRGQFLLESLADLRQQLRSRGSDLVIRQGQPEHVIPTLAQEWGVEAVYAHEEVGTEEKEVAAAVERALRSLGIRLQVDWGHTLYHPEDLPFCLSQLLTSPPVAPQTVHNDNESPAPQPRPATPPPTNARRM